MISKKQKLDFLDINKKILCWYARSARDLPFRKTRDPYKIWICEIVFQQTRISQGIAHYEKFIQRYPNVQELAQSDLDEILVYWRGLGYYSRAHNIYKASLQIMNDFGGKFPNAYEDILKLKGIGKYTAAAISSICFSGRYPAIDGNFYRVMSRFLASEYDISKTGAYKHFSEISMPLFSEGNTGDLNQAIMDLGSVICKPKKPLCKQCPIHGDCLAFANNNVEFYPVKSKKTHQKNESLTYYFIEYQNQFLAKKRNDNSIWKNLYEFPPELPSMDSSTIILERKPSTIFHQLTHKRLMITIHHVYMKTGENFSQFARENACQIIPFHNHKKISLPRPLERYIENLLEALTL
ncbi:MAG: A/G-specific adenine glycosylase [Bergeyella sp.]|nr:A/G-specific adenine glycosylase [Bergeyella sp.]